MKIALIFVGLAVLVAVAWTAPKCDSWTGTNITIGHAVLVAGCQDTRRNPT